MTTSTLASHEETAPPVAIRSHSVVAERRTWRLLFLLAIMGVMWIAFNQMTDGIYITPRNLSNLAVQAAITGVVAIGVGALLIAREIDLSVGSLLGAVVVISVWLQVDHRWTALPTVLVALGFGLAIGLFQGLCTTVLRIPSFIVTLAAFSYLRGVAYGVTGSVTLFGTTSSFRSVLRRRVLGAGDGHRHRRCLRPRALLLGVAAMAASPRDRHRGDRPEPATGRARSVLRCWELVCGLALWVFVSYQGLPAPVAILLTIALVAAFVGRHTAFGRHIYAIGGNPEGARRAGINVTGVVVVLFMFSGALAALGGIMQAARLDAGPPNLGLLLALDAISAAVVGGTYLFGGQGSVSGILTGTLFLASIQNGLNLKGVAHVLAVHRVGRHPPRGRRGRSARSAPSPTRLMAVVAPLLAGSQLTKHYGAVEALRGVNFEIKPNEIVGFAGDNGAGKSTLMKIVAGSVRPTTGTLLFEGDEISDLDPAHSRRRGIEMVYQDLALCENLDARENIFLGREPRRGWLGLRMIASEKMTHRTLALLERLEIEITSVFEPMSVLSGGQRQAVAICRALAFKPRLIVMDEPTAALSVNAVQPLLRLVRRLPTEGASVVLVSHRLSDLLTVTDRIYVLRNGEIVAELQTAQTDEDELLRLMAGLRARA